jgi:hypothetical protein
MKQARRFGPILPLISLILASIACYMPAITSGSDANVAATATTPATAAFDTQTSDTNGPSQNMEAEGAMPTEPQAPTPSPTPTLTPTITPTPTPAAPMVSVSINTNCRFGPGEVYEYQGALMVGEEAEVKGKLADESFWYIENPDAPPPYCWIWAAYAQVEGDTSDVPILTPPPTPTPEVTPTPELYSVSGVVFKDTDEDGLRDSGEGGLHSFQVDLREDDCGGTVVASELTGMSGQFSFSGIPPGTYWIVVYYASGWCMEDVRVHTRPTSYTFVLGPDRQFLFGFNCHFMGP